MCLSFPIEEKREEIVSHCLTSFQHYVESAEQKTISFCHESSLMSVDSKCLTIIFK
jgi:hypothetical protein